MKARTLIVTIVAGFAAAAPAAHPAGAGNTPHCTKSSKAVAVESTSAGLLLGKRGKPTAAACAAKVGKSAAKQSSATRADKTCTSAVTPQRRDPPAAIPSASVPANVPASPDGPPLFNPNDEQDQYVIR